MNRDLYRRLGQAAADNDALAEEHGDGYFELVLEQLDLEVAAVMEFTMQRGMRMRLIETGRREELAQLQLDRRPKLVSFDAADQAAIARYAACVTDGMVAVLRMIDRLDRD